MGVYFVQQTPIEYLFGAHLAAANYAPTWAIPHSQDTTKIEGKQSNHNIPYLLLLFFCAQPKFLN